MRLLLICISLMYIYSKQHNKFLFPALAGAIYGSSCKAENEISKFVNYSIRNQNRQNQNGYVLFGAACV